MKRFIAWLSASFDAWRASLPEDPAPAPTLPFYADPHPERS